MRWILFALIAVACCAIPGHAQSAKDVPEVASWEIQRRGNHVERTGTVRSGLMAAALSPPADDSHKWFLTLVVEKGHTGCATMEHTIATDREMHAWVDTVEPSRSTMHYQVRTIGDPTQADWFAGIKPAIEKEKLALPILVLQPPRSGQFGDPKTVVKLLGGVMAGKDLSDKLRSSIVSYVKELESPRSGVSQEITSVAPPFSVPPRDNPVAPGPPPNPGLPFEWPPSAPSTLTCEQIQLACPGADPKFVLDCLTAKDANIDVVKLKWRVFQSEHPGEVLRPIPDPDNRHHDRDDVDAAANPFSWPALPISPWWTLAYLAGLMMAFGGGAMTVIAKIQLDAKNARAAEDAALLASLKARLSQLDQAQTTAESTSTAKAPQPIVPPPGMPPVPNVKPA